MATKLEVTVDRSDPARLTLFWATALRYETAGRRREGLRGRDEPGHVAEGRPLG
jgi:hypothetical protein